MKTILRWDLSIILVLFGFFAYHLYLDEREKEQSYHFERVQKLQLQYDTIVNAQNALADLIFNSWINREPVLALMAEAKQGAPEVREQARQKLYETLHPLYLNLQRNNIGQLHFHTPDSRSFLRFHRPERYGDDLSSVRFSVAKVNRELTPVRGFEEGRTFTGFRYLYPLHYRGEHVGSVEMGFTFEAIRNYLYDGNPVIYHFIVSKAVVADRLFPEERRRYIPCDLCSAYLYDKGVAASNPDDVLSAEQRLQLKDLVDSRFAADPGGASFSFSPKLGEERFSATFLSVENLQGQHVAYIVSIHQDPMMEELTLSFKKSLLLVVLFALFFLVVVYFLYLKKREQDAYQRANIDYLTRSYNRRNCHERIVELIQSHQVEHKPCAMLLVDIDHFKNINERNGEPSGDRVLVTLAGLLRQTVRSSDIVCRWGADEFVVIINTDLPTAERVAEKIRKSVEETSFEESGEITVSIGITRIEPGDTDENCFKRADMALYEAKEQGRNRCVSYL